MSAFAADPDYLTETRRLMADAQAAFEGGDLAGSADGFMRVARRHPAAVGGWVQAAAAGLRAGVSLLALTAARRAVLLDPASPSATALLTVASTAEPLAGRHRATALWALTHPGKAEALGALASSYQELGRLREAERAARDALRADPNMAWVRVNLAVILRESGREREAETELRRAVIAEPGTNLAWRRLAGFAETLSKLELAGRAARRALIIDAEDHVSAVFLSIVERRQGDLEGALHRLQALPEALDGEAGRDAVEFELGTVLDRLGQYDEAWAHFERGNEIAVQRAPSGTADPRLFLNTLNAYAGAVSDGWPTRWTPLPEAEPPAVFMVGFPRSGTTLLDQILDAHPDAGVIEEQPVLSSVGAGFAALGEGTLAERLAALTQADADKLRAEYRAKLARWAGEEGSRPRVVIDKMPLNIVYLPLALRLYPKAKVILSLRHPCDCCLSCFMQSIRLNSAMASFTSMEGATGFYARVMALWQEIERALSPDHITVRYEDLVADTEGTARRVTSFLGLDWTDAVLDHTAHAKARGMIRTPSFRQVSEPIYTRAVGRWARYRDQMAPYLDTLAPYAEHFGYGDPGIIPRGEDEAQG
ncbi:tetratricopeptide repeat-containing sulfotransferase family protein [Nisaea denitrificans]|uniref:tetratricopeptide repeat-containing sulfotransferase family protein n=1 Tax=Nisaea denitrificans TaxID=390877 RepID=UPI00041B467E|nr:tetratricopeptide repeat-containing sulfotransferase family protein [Nisaea denitrificans]